MMYDRKNEINPLYIQPSISWGDSSEVIIFLLLLFFKNCVYWNEGFFNYVCLGFNQLAFDFCLLKLGIIKLCLLLKNTTPPICENSAVVYVMCLVKVWVCWKNTMVVRNILQG